MEQNSIDAIYNMLDSIKVTADNELIIEDIRESMENGEYMQALAKLQSLTDDFEDKDLELVEEIEEGDSLSDSSEETQEQNKGNIKDNKDNAGVKTGENDGEDKKTEEENLAEEENEEESIIENESEIYESAADEKEALYPKELSDTNIEHQYIGMLLTNPKLITKFYYTYPECYFEDDMALNNYKSVLFTESSKYTPEKAKQGFNFARETAKSRELKEKWKEDALNKKYDMEKIFVELKKLFVLRKAFLETPIQEAQERIVEIRSYILYKQMSIEEVESAVNQVNETGKFKRAVISKGLADFLKKGENNLTEGLEMPFPILSSVFKGIRKGETMSFAMPSNAGKSRFTINLAAHTALIHKQKVLIISNEMSEEKMRLCLITTILNNPNLQKLHGQELHKTEGELLEFKFRPDNVKEVKVDEDGFVVQEENESREDFVKRLSKISSEFNKTIAATDWVNKQIENSIYFINITDHTNEELKKVIMNYYYKEKIEYVFYDTLKTDTEHIGSGEEIKKTATILSNLAQNFGMFICSTMQLTESSTLPVNLTINDLAVSRTVKEVLDTLCLIKQINRDNYQEYEYSLNEVDTKFFNLKKFDDPDVRYYACVVDKNRAGAKPKLLFRLNLAYNSWEELGYVRLKQG